MSTRNMDLSMLRVDTGDFFCGLMADGQAACTARQPARTLPTNTNAICEYVDTAAYPAPASATVLRVAITPRIAATTFGRLG